jgi:hypothetical protein
MSNNMLTPSQSYETDRELKKWRESKDYGKKESSLPINTYLARQDEEVKNLGADGNAVSLCSTAFPSDLKRYPVQVKEMCIDNQYIYYIACIDIQYNI